MSVRNRSLQVLLTNDEVFDVAGLAEVEHRSVSAMGRILMLEALKARVKRAQENFLLSGDARTAKRRAAR